MAVGILLVGPQELAPKQAQGSGIDSALEKIKKGEFEEATQILKEAQEKDPTNWVLKGLLQKAMLLRFRDTIETAKERFEANPKDVEAYGVVAEAFKQMGDSFLALMVLTQGVSHNVRATELWLSIAQLELEANREHEAQSVYMQVLSYEPKNNLAHHKLAQIFHNDVGERDLKRAHTHAIQAVSLAPQNPYFIDTLAEVEYSLGHSAKAIALMRKAIILNPNESEFLQNLNRFQDNP